MKLASNNIKTTISGEGIDTENLGFNNKEDQAIVALLLTQAVYTDPERTVVGEYASNARDAHREAGKADIPIHITTPDRWGSRDFVIEDEGVGMTGKDLGKYFGGLGASSKRDTNDLNGGFGIGCKSAYAIDGLESFTVSTVKDGIRTVAVMSKKDDGTLTRSILPSTETTDGNGTVVRIPIPDESIDKINARVKEVFSTWEPGSVLVDGEIPESIHSGDFYKVGDKGWISRKSDSYSYDSAARLRVISGDGAYNLNLNSSDIYEICGEYAYLVSSYGGYTIYLNSKIGQVEVSANRSDVRLRSSTRKTLRELFLAFCEELKSEVEANLATATTEAEALQSVSEASRYMRNKDVKWNGAVVPIRVDASGSDYRYSRGNRSRSNNYGSSVIEVPVRSAEVGRESQESDIYILDTTNVKLAASTLLGHMTTYVKTDEFDVNQFRLLLLDDDWKDNEWISGAVENNYLKVLDAEKVVEASKAYRRANRATGGPRGATMYDFYMRVGDKILRYESDINGLREEISNAGGSVLLHDRYRNDHGVDVFQEYVEHFTKDDIIVVNNKNRSKAILLERLKVSEMKAVQEHLEEILTPQIAALKDRIDELAGVVRISGRSNFVNTFRNFSAAIARYDLNLTNKHFARFIGRDEAAEDVREQWSNLVHSATRFGVASEMIVEIRDAITERATELALEFNDMYCAPVVFQQGITTMSGYFTDDKEKELYTTLVGMVNDLTPQSDTPEAAQG